MTAQLGQSSRLAVGSSEEPYLLFRFPGAEHQCQQFIQCDDFVDLVALDSNGSGTIFRNQYLALRVAQIRQD